MVTTHDGVMCLLEDVGKHGRISRVGQYKMLDLTPGLFANVPFRLPADKWQIGFDVEAISHADSIQTESFDGTDRQITEAIRAQSHRLGRVFPMSRLKQAPATMYVDAPSLLLPLDNRLNLDWLTYHSDEWRSFIYDFCDELLKNHPVSDVEDSVRILLTDYSSYVPFTSSIRKGTRMRVSYDDAAVKNFRETLGEYIISGYFRSRHEDCLPRMNATKSVGWPFQYPDGTPISGDEYLYMPETFQALTFARKNFRTFKLDWAHSGRVEETLRFILENPGALRDPRRAVENFENNRFEIHTEADRRNNGDEWTNPLPSGSLLSLKGQLVHKDRDWCFESAPYTYKSGIYDQSKVTALMSNHGRTELDLRRRAMFPSNTASRDVAAIYMYRRIWHDMEEGPTGFPSLRPSVLSRYAHFISETTQYENWKIIQFDRRTAEQFITDNFSTLAELYPERFRDLFLDLSTAIIPSVYGPRCVSGGLISGGAGTTGDNGTMGLFELSQLVSTFETKRPFDPAIHLSVCKRFQRSLESGGFVIGKDPYGHNFHLCLNLGTDDQYQPLAYNGRFIEDRMNSYAWEERFLKHSFENTQTGFGLFMSRNGFTVNPTLGLSKLFLHEKFLYGDACAAKMACRLDLLPDYYDDIQRTFEKHKFGSLKTYYQGREAYKKLLKTYGFDVEGFYNEYSPLDKIIYGPLIDVSIESDRYPPEVLEPINNLLATQLAA